MIINKILPLERYILTTHLSTMEVRQRIADSITTSKNTDAAASTTYPSKPYTGEVSGDSFTISRIIDYRNAFLPVISGDISGFISPTKVHIEMTLTRFWLIFLYSWIGVIGIICAGILLICILQFRQVLQSGIPLILLLPFAMFAVGCFLTIVPFKREIKRSKQFLAQLLDGQEITNK